MFMEKKEFINRSTVRGGIKWEYTSKASVKLGNEHHVVVGVID